MVGVVGERGCIVLAVSEALKIAVCVVVIRLPVAVRISYLRNPPRSVACEDNAFSGRVNDPAAVDR